MKAAWKVVSSILPVSKSHPSSKIAESLQAIEQRSSPAFLPFLVFGGTTRYTFGLMLKDAERRWKSTRTGPLSFPSFRRNSFQSPVTACPPLSFVEPSTLQRRSFRTHPRGADGSKLALVKMSQLWWDLRLESWTDESVRFEHFKG